MVNSFKAPLNAASHLGLFCLFKRKFIEKWNKNKQSFLMPQSFVTTVPTPTYGEGWGIAGLKSGTITVQVTPQCRGNDGVLTLDPYPRELFYCEGLPPGGGAHSRALKAEKS